MNPRRLFLQFLRDGKSPSQARDRLLAMNWTREVADETLSWYQDIARSTFYRPDGIEGIVEATDPEGSPWYVPFDGPVWQNYRRNLEQKDWGDEAMARFDESTDGVTARLANPAAGQSQQRGLVVGHVQSGKTAHFLGVAAKAIDAGYRSVIVLSGITNILRRQTQDRLEKDLVQGVEDLLGLATELPPTGAGGDFTLRRGTKATDQNCTATLLVVKKNAAVLTKLSEWLDSATTVERLCPALIIDDEADNASLNAAASPQERTRVNALVLEFLRKLRSHSFVGYTATPFANILTDLDPDGNTGELYPRDFIVSLPAGDGYVGADQLFGTSANVAPNPSVQIVDESDTEEAQSGAMTARLRTAIRWFLIATAVRSVRQGFIPPSTMLVHPSVRVAVHRELARRVRLFVESERDRLSRGDDAEYEALFTTRSRDLGVPEAWEDVRPRLAAVADAIETVIENGTVRNRVDWGNGQGAKIVVGGQVLSRGLTLPGLVVSFITRESDTYDSILQAGRWFGYRHGYGDLATIYLTRKLRDAHAHLSRVEREIREEIRQYTNQGVSPLVLGVRIREHEGLKVTLPNKMRNAQRVAKGFSERRLETLFLETEDTGVIARNLEAANQLVGTGVGANWSQVPWQRVHDFLNAYSFVAGRTIDLPRVLEYLEKETAEGSLHEWHVAVVTNSGNPRQMQIGGVGRGLNVRSRLAGPPNPASLGVLVSTRDLAIDLHLTPQEIGSMTAAEIRAMRPPRTGLLLLYPIDRDSQPSTPGRVPLGAAMDLVGVGIQLPASVRDEPEKFLEPILPDPDDPPEEPVEFDPALEVAEDD